MKEKSMRNFWLLFLLPFLFPINLSAQVTDIIALHQNDGNGYPENFGQSVTIQGIVTCERNIFHSSEITIQDDTGGMTIFDSGMSINPGLGDEVQLTGLLDFYNGLTELSDLSQAAIITTGNPVPDPQVLTCDQAAHAYDLNTDQDNDEGRLIRINQVTYEFDYNAGNNIVGVLTDDTGTCAIFIDSDSDVQEPASGAAFDVVGILKQYDSSSPYTTGYQIVPRYASDIISGTGPQITFGPREIAIEADRVTLAWTTSDPCGSAIRYGLTTDYELGEISHENYTTVHEVTIPNLSSATAYHGRVMAVTTEGTSSSPDYVFATASANSSGDIYAYFSHSVDHTYANEIPAEGDVNLSNEFGQLIDNAQVAIDLCFYNISRPTLATKLINAKNRGVTIRVVYETDYVNEVTADLENAGIPIIFDNDSGHYMHNKFAIFDHRLDTDESNDILWTGSWNASFAGTYDNAEHAVVIHDAAICEAYTIEFNEMWGGVENLPNLAHAKFGAAKTDNTPHYFNINGMWVEQFMSPSDRPDQQLIETIHTANEDLFFAIYSFTLNSVSDAMHDRFFDGVAVRGVFDVTQAGSDYSEYNSMSGWADVFTDGVSGGILHHKYLLVDPLHPGSDPQILTGSYNWSVSATDSNDENMIIFHDHNLCNVFLQEFVARYHEAGGQWTNFVGLEDAAGETPWRTACYPNPYWAGSGQGDRLRFAFNLPINTKAELAVYNTTGQIIKKFDPVLSGAHGLMVEWNGQMDTGEVVSTGLYFFQLRVNGDAVQSGKFLLIK